MSDTTGKLDSGACGGLVGQAIVAAGLAALVAVYSVRPVALAAAMAAGGAVAVIVTWRVARVRRRFFSAVQWLALGGLLLAAYLLLKSGPSAELRRFWDEDPWRERNVLLVAAAMLGVGVISLWMLRRGHSDA